MVQFDYPVHHAEDIWDAMQVAEALCESGEYDLFRGQRKDYPLVPTALRESVDANEVGRRLNELAGWVSQTAELSSLHHNADAILAVAQHYGLPTPLLDFSYSPKIACFFATDGAELGDTGTLVCINKDRFKKSWQDINERYFSDKGHYLTEVVEVDVRNLWRMQAQQGLFVRCHVDPMMLEMFSHMLHINFPQTVHAEICSRDEIYPVEKSHLEVLLDQYFLIDSYPERQRQLTESWGPPIASLSEEDVRQEQMTYFKSGKQPQPHRSWMSKSAQTWLLEPNEHFGADVRSRSVTITVSDGEYEPQLAEKLELELLNNLTPKQGAKRDSIDWKVVFPNGQEAYNSPEGMTPTKDEWAEFKISEMVDAIYSGMRNLPYSHEQVARAIARYIMMVQFGCYSVIEQTEGLEFDGGGFNCRGFCSRKNVVAALREDFFDLIDPSRLNDEGLLDFRDTLFVARQPKSSYDFDKFLDLFVDDLIPSHAAVAIESLVICLNPMKIEVLGES